MEQPKQPLHELLLTSGMLPSGPGGIGPHRRGRGRAVWFLQHGDFCPSNPDGKAMKEFNLPYQYFDINVNVAVLAKEFADALDKEAKIKNDPTIPGSPFRHDKDPLGDFDMSISCLDLAKACGVNAPEQFHHNAGIDARESLASVLRMMFLYPGVCCPKAGPHMPILAAVDFERAENPAARGGCVSEVGVSVLDLNDVIEFSGDICTKIKSYHTLVQGRENFHPLPETEANMGIPPEFELKLRCWFVYGVNPQNTRTFQIKGRAEENLKNVLIAGDSEITPLPMLSAWVKTKVAVQPSRGSIGFPVNPQLRYCWSM